jgi:hypothetical protein
LPLRGLEESLGETVTVAELATVEPPTVLLVLNVVGAGAVGAVAAVDEAAGAEGPEPAPGKHCE